MSSKQKTPKQNEKKQKTPKESEKEINHDKKVEVSVMNPWTVKGPVAYLDQITKYGTSPIDGVLLNRWRKVTGIKPHRLIRRGLVFSHQDIEKVLDAVEAGIPVYVYTGRGPSSDTMHLGHMVPFMLTRYLQQALNCIVVIQMSDDEKFFFKAGTTPKDLKEYNDYTYKNALDIIACGFDINKTLIFSNLEYNSGHLYFNNTLLMKNTTMNQVRGIYGLGELVDQNVVDLCKKEMQTETDPEKIASYQKIIKNHDGVEQSNNVGQCVWPCFQCGPAFCTSFRDIFINAIKHALINKKLPDYVANNYKAMLKDLSDPVKGGNILCLVPMAIDQSPYFRMARDCASILKCPKPAVIHSEFLPGLKQSEGKMSSTTGESDTLFLDLNPEKVKKLIKSFAFSGGRETLEEHKKYGGNIKIDICYQYLLFFLESDEELKNIAKQYTDGTMTTGQLKEFTSTLIANIIQEHQKTKARITPEILKQYFDSTRTFDIGGVYDREIIKEGDEEEDYSKYGIDFDRTFGLAPKC